MKIEKRASVTHVSFEDLDLGDCFHPLDDSVLYFMKIRNTTDDDPCVDGETMQPMNANNAVDLASGHAHWFDLLDDIVRLPNATFNPGS